MKLWIVNVLAIPVAVERVEAETAFGGQNTFWNSILDVTIILSENVRRYVVGFLSC
jgi:hypothetical protein